jgi:2-methylcitrate dehydratase PrpD
VAVAAADTDIVEIATDVAVPPESARDPEAGATILASGKTARPTQVAFVNGVMAHALDYDDTDSVRMYGHPSAPVLPAALATAEATGATGREFLTAFVLGIEVELELGRSLGRAAGARGFHPTSVIGQFGAVSAAGFLRDLSPSEVATAYGLSASQFSGTKLNFGTMTKPYQVGNAARSAVEAIQLAAEGFTANAAVLTEDFDSLSQLFGHDDPRPLDGLGQPWGLADYHVWFKDYPSCGSTHPAIKAAVELRADHDLVPDRIESIELTHHPDRYVVCDRPAPTTGLAGKFSIQYCTAVALYSGVVRMDDFSPEAMSRPGVRALLDRVHTHADPDLPEWGADVEVTVTDGSTRHNRLAHEPGRGESSVSSEQLAAKFETCAGRVFDAPTVERSIDTVRNVDSLDSVDPLVAGLVSK